MSGAAGKSARRHAFGGGRFERTASYSRALRTGNLVFVAGTTAVEPSGKLHAPDDSYAQSMYIFGRIEQALEDVGAKPRHVVRTTAFVTDMAHTGGYARAHGEFFEGINPVTTAVEAGLTTPGMVVEIAVDAVVDD